MSWICPECKIVLRSGGLCPCSDLKDRPVYLVEQEEEMKNVIRWTGNTERFKGQTKGVLLSAELQIVKEIKQELRDHVGEDALPRGSAILCVFQGDKGIPFVELRNYGSASLSKLKKAVGQVFEIDVPAKEKQEELMLSN